LPCTRFDSQLLGFCLRGAAPRCFLGPHLGPVRLAAFLGAALTFLPTFPRFEAVPLRATRSFRLAMTVSH
jgi:hypothetical protein